MILNMKRILGTGSHAKRKQAMQRHLQYSYVFKQYFTNLRDEHYSMMTGIFSSLEKAIQKQAEKIIQDLRASVTVEGELTEADQVPEFVERLSHRLGTLRECLQRTEGIIAQLKQ